MFRTATRGETTFGVPISNLEDRHPHDVRRGSSRVRGQRVQLSGGH